MGNNHFRSTEEVFHYLMQYVNVEKGQKTEFKLDRMNALADALGKPHEGRLTIHVAGSKGKGSVSAMCAAILEAAGYRTGLYTSPHLIRWKERITLAGKEIEESVLLSGMDMLMPHIEGRKPEDFPGGEAPTFFELTTLLSFIVFRSLGCTAQVIETGLGGRLDSTNIVESDCAVITPIELEHTQFLGDTIAKIAFEKAGIIKPGKPVCIAPQRAEAEPVFAGRAKALSSPLLRLGVDLEMSNAAIDRHGTSCTLKASGNVVRALPEVLGGQGLAVRSPMVGSIQAQNMGLAVLAAGIVLPGLEGRAIREGLSRAVLPARFEVLESDPPVILDGAHTPDSVRLALSSMNTLFPGPKTLLFACAHDKNHEEMAKVLTGSFERIFITKPGTFKVSEPEAVFRSFSSKTDNVQLVQETAEAVHLAFAYAQERGYPLLVTGSFYLCAEARATLYPA